MIESTGVCGKQEDYIHDSLYISELHETFGEPAICGSKGVDQLPITSFKQLNGAL